MKKTLSTSMIAAALTATLTMTAFAEDTETFVESFDTAQSNNGGWHFTGFDTWQSSGGNPGGYRRVDGLDTFAPLPRTTLGANTIFHGNYIEQGVTSIGIDARTFNNPTTGGRPMTLMLFHQNTAAYYLGPNIPHQSQGWVSYDYDVPSQSETLPPGWQLLNMNDSGSPADHTWAQVMADVQRVGFHYGDPTMFFIFQMWNLGIDNARISWIEKEDIPGDLNGDGVVNVSDMLLLFDAWGTCNDCDDCPADLNGDCEVNVTDLLIMFDNWG